MLRLAAWMVDYYLCTWAQVLEALVPAGVRFQAGTRDPARARCPTKWPPNCPSSNSPPNSGRSSKPWPPRGPLPIAPALPVPPAARWCRSARCGRKGLVLLTAERLDASQHAETAATAREDHLKLNADQRAALDAILAALEAGRHETILLHGVTGSGKTEVYIQAIEEVRPLRPPGDRAGAGDQPDAADRVSGSGRGSASVAVLHSHLTDAERHRHWQRIAARRGAGRRRRPQRRLRAHAAPGADRARRGARIDRSSKTTAPRYHARDVALQRAAAEGIPLVLGSATPSLESWQRAPTRASITLVDDAAPRARPAAAGGRHDRPARAKSSDRRSRGAISRPLRRGHGRGARRRRAGDPAAQSPRLLARTSNARPAATWSNVRTATSR